MFRWHVISGICIRNLKQYFSSALGYVFIVAFVTISALMTFNSQFFADNLASLDQLTRWFPLLLLFFAPAVAMSVWAEERRSGTDAILFTLPATDLEILLGKYFAISAVYTISLLFSFTQLIALNALGSPDWGVIISTYFGYWLAGLALLSIGMFASSLTESTTVAFVLGALLCAVPVLIGNYLQGTIDFGSWFGWNKPPVEVEAAATTANPVAAFRPEVLSVQWNLHDFTTGLIPLSNVVYFVSLIVFMLYLNLVVISRRHWSRGQQATLAGQFGIRIVSLAVGLLALNYIVGGLSSSALSRLDLTKEKLFSLDKTTLSVLDYAKENKKLVTIQAFVSDEVPRRFVNTKKQLLGLLKQLDYHGGNYVDVQVTNVRPNSEEALAAQRLGIEPQSDRSEVGGRIIEQEVFLGTHLFSDLGDATLPAI
ncbi:MAG: Gldg family protein, partial [Planctomycetota bacterium]